jgi:hypothetical protein
MPSTTYSAACCTLLAVTMLAGSGCATAFGPSLGIFGVPIPVSPYHQKIKEDQFWEHERYDRAIVLPPIPPGGPALAIDEPSDDQVMRQLERIDQVQGGLPFLHEIQRNNVLIVKEKIADNVDPPRVYPLVGPAQLHHSRWKCTVHYTRVARVGWPLPHTLVDDVEEVIYIDQSHLHMVGNVEADTIGVAPAAGLPAPPVGAPLIPPGLPPAPPNGM